MSDGRSRKKQAQEAYLDGFDDWKEHSYQRSVKWRDTDLMTYYVSGRMNRPMFIAPTASTLNG